MPLLSLAFLACNDQNVGIYNTPPSVLITWPEDGSVVPPGETLELEGRATDDQQSAESLVVSWSSSLDGQLGEVVPDADGVVKLPVTGLTTGTHAITLTAMDDAAVASQETITVDVGFGNGAGAPIVTLIGPADGDPYQRSELIQVVGTATDNEQPWDSLQATIMSSRNGILWEGSPAPNGAVSVQVGDLDIGSHTLSLVVLDDDGNTGQAEATIEIIDDAVPSVVVWSPQTNDSFWTTDTITCEGEVSDDVTPAADLQLTWHSDLQGDIWTGASDTSGYTSVGLTLIEGVHNLSLKAVDEDGLIGSDAVTIEVIDPLNHDADGDGETENEGDCDDDNPQLNTGATEVCDGVDQNCDGYINEPWWDNYETNESSGAAYDLGEIDQSWLWDGDSLTVSGLTMHEPGDEDWFTFDVDDDWYDNANFTVTASGLNGNGVWVMELWDMNGSPKLEASNSGTNKVTVSFSGSLTDTGEDNWAIRIYSTTWTAAACTTAYKFLVST